MSRATTLVVCTINRPAILDQTLRSLLSQPGFDSPIVVCSGSETSTRPDSTDLRGVTFFTGRKGLTRQRNAALRLVRSKYVLFLDDDVELDTRYIDNMEALFDSRHEIVLASGHAVLDRFEARTMVTRSVAIRALKESATAGGVEDSPRWIRGHNMFVRTEVARNVGFDERLPLYGLYEDLDFLSRCQRYGKAVHNRDARLVHLGILSGRINDVRLGYSQFANSWYLVNKGIWKAGIVLRIWARELAKNLLRSCIISSTELCDRRARLKGNLFAIADLCRGRLDPENILNLQDQE
jgi:glycosyltransferase involved in cell wall biosynthesis